MDMDHIFKLWVTRIERFHDVRYWLSLCDNALLIQIIHYFISYQLLNVSHYIVQSIRIYTLCRIINMLQHLDVFCPPLMNFNPTLWAATKIIPFSVEKTDKWYLNWYYFPPPIIEWSYSLWHSFVTWANIVTTQVFQAPEYRSWTAMIMFSI